MNADDRSRPSTAARRPGSAIPLRILVTGLVGFIAIAGGVAHLLRSSILVELCQEDAIVESATAVLYFVTAALFVIGNRAFRMRNIWFWLFALLFFVIAGEEISWGQRVFGLDTPEGFAEINVQEETNLHNIEGIHGSIRAIALLIVLGICFVIPGSNSLFKRFGQLYRTVGMPIFPLWAGVMVVIAILLMAIPRVLFGVVVFELDELGELILAIAFLVFGLQVVCFEHGDRGGSRATFGGPVTAS